MKSMKKTKQKNQRNNKMKKSFSKKNLQFLIKQTFKNEIFKILFLIQLLYQKKGEKHNRNFMLKEILKFSSTSVNLLIFMSE